MQLAKLKKLEKKSPSAVGGSELAVRSCSNSGVGGNLGMNLSKLRLLTRTSSVAKPISIDKLCSHGKKDCKRQKGSNNFHDMKKVKLGEWQSVVSVMEDNVEHALSVNLTAQYGYWLNRFDKFCVKFHRHKQLLLLVS